MFPRVTFVGGNITFAVRSSAGVRQFYGAVPWAGRSRRHRARWLRGRLL